MVLGCGSSRREALSARWFAVLIFASSSIGVAFSSRDYVKILSNFRRFSGYRALPCTLLHKMFLPTFYFVSTGYMMLSLTKRSIRLCGFLEVGNLMLLSTVLS